MASLHDALGYLAPLSWEEVPQSPDRRREFLREIFVQARRIVDSVPEPPSPAATAADEQHDSDASIRAAATVIPSKVRLTSSESTAETEEIDSERQVLQAQWGQPLKLKRAENALAVSIYALKGRDGRGTWFGRRSVHEGLPFARWKARMQRELDETCRVNRERQLHGLEPNFAIRAIGAQDKLEDMPVLDADGKTLLGRIAVYYVSAQFPRPTTSRDFVTLAITFEQGVLDAVASASGASESHRRSWMMVSRPCEHSRFPPSDRYIRGQYESVELIREIVMPGSEQPADSGENESLRARHNPVEWIMVTRSDPGGNIPRWMVEKGTPKSIASDAFKFVQWAVDESGSTTPEREAAEEAVDHRASSADYPEEDLPPILGDRMKKRPSSRDNVGGEIEYDDRERRGNAGDDSAIDDDDDGDDEEEEEEQQRQVPTTRLQDQHTQHTGLIATVASLLSIGIDKLAPDSVRGYLPRPTYDNGYADYMDEATEDVDDVDDDNSYYSPSSGPDPEPELDSKRDDMAGGEAGGTGQDTSIATEEDKGNAGVIASSLGSSLSTPSSNLHHAAMRAQSPPLITLPARADVADGKTASGEKQLAKLEARKQQVIARLESLRREIVSLQPAPESKRGSAEDGRTHPSNGGTAAANADSKPPPSQELLQTHKATSSLLRKESKLVKQLQKIEDQQTKTAAKIQTRRQKRAERHEKARARSETEALRHRVHELDREVQKLRAERQTWLDLVGNLQAENTRLAAAAAASAISPGTGQG